jgi:hypothetical protein
MNMKLRLVLVLSLAGLLSGCAQHYNIQTSRGVITSKGKPQQDKARGVFIYHDAQGNERTIPAGSVQQIYPSSDAPSPSQFRAPGAK